MYPLANLEPLLTKNPFIKLATFFTKASPMHPLTNLEIPVNKESIDKISTPFT